LKVQETKIKGLLVIKPRVFEDERGYFFESFNQDTFTKATGLDTVFIQDNESKSVSGVLRGLHFQIPPMGQAKLVRVNRGRVLDVAVDLRQGSPTFGKYEAVELSAENKLQFYIPEGFAHGFLTLEDDTVFVYKCSQVYSRDHERSLKWDDPALAIQWGTTSPVVSEKDALAEGLESFVSPFLEMKGA
jgi:dTDP-4-dehydrorhamnose 3,5-epimerase